MTSEGIRAGSGCEWLLAERVGGSDRYRAIKDCPITGGQAIDSGVSPSHSFWLMLWDWRKFFAGWFLVGGDFR